MVDSAWMNLLYVYDDHLGSGCHRFIYFNEKSLLNRAVIMSSRVFYIDSYENLKIGSVGSMMLIP